MILTRLSAGKIEACKGPITKEHRFGTTSNTLQPISEHIRGTHLKQVAITPRAICASFEGGHMTIEFSTDDVKTAEISSLIRTPALTQAELRRVIVSFGSTPPFYTNTHRYVYHEIPTEYEGRVEIIPNKVVNLNNITAVVCDNVDTELQTAGVITFTTKTPDSADGLEANISMGIGFVHTPNKITLEYQGETHVFHTEG